MAEKKLEKQRYERPTLRKIDLAAEQVLATGCKTVDTSGPGDFCDVTACSAEGTS